MNSCKSHHHCPPGQFCCGPGKVGKCAASCVGKLCKYGYRCTNEESCCSDVKCAASCVGKFCQHDYRCASGESCRSDGKCAASCVGTSCEDNSDCGTGETCCDRVKSKGKCATSCIGKSCKKYGSHCATREYCCSFSGTCGLNCIGQVCLSDNNCAPKQTCCGLSDGNKGTSGRFCAGGTCKNDAHCGSASIVVVLIPHALQNVLSKCAPVVIIVERVNSAVVMLLVLYANVRNHALIYHAHITVSVHQAKIVVLTKSAP